MNKYIVKIISWAMPVKRWRHHFRSVYQEKKTADALRKLLVQYWDKVPHIMYGPFKNMRYIDSANGSKLLPKLVGCYEDYIHTWIAEIPGRAYDLILDIGCAEGYYAVGFAYKDFAPIVHAFDIDETARSNAAKLAVLNGMSDRVIIGGECNGAIITELTRNKRALIFCDIEGGENSLLDPIATPALRHVDLIVETHDFLYPGTTNRLIGHFMPTHRVEVMSEMEIKHSAYPIFDKMRQKRRRLLTFDSRPRGMLWLRLTAR